MNKYNYNKLKLKKKYLFVYKIFLDTQLQVKKTEKDEINNNVGVLEFTVLSTITKPILSIN